MSRSTEYHDEMETTERGERPLVSVIVPTYDRPDMLVEAVESVTDQTYPNVELLVVDDASPRPAGAVLADCGPEVGEWRCLRHEENRGANAARNTGIEAATGEILAFLDDDDRWRPETIEAQVSALTGTDAETGVSVVGQRMHEAGSETTIRLPIVEGDATPELIRGKAAGSFSTMAVRRWAVEAAGLPDERFASLQDREWMVRLSQHCKFVSVREPLVERRFGDYEQINDAFESRRDNTVPLFVEKHRELAAEYGCERQFRSWLATSTAGSGLVNGHYDDARQFAARAIRTYPRQYLAYVYLLLALGGRLTYRPAVRLARLTRGFKRKFPNRPV